MVTSEVSASEDLLPLKASELRDALVGKLISYNPPGWADIGVHEEFHPDGSWRGILYGRGPIPFTGRWAIQGDQMCVTADSGTVAESWHKGEYCRKVWRNPKTGQLQIYYLPDQPSSPQRMGLQTISVRQLDTIR